MGKLWRIMFHKASREIIDFRIIFISDLTFLCVWFQVNTNGVISFLVAVSQYTPAPFPLGDNRRLISPFWGDVDTRKGGTVLYRESIDPVLLDRATKDVRRAFLNHQRFSASWIFIVTWDRVAFYGAKGNFKNKVIGKYKVSALSQASNFWP